MEVENEGKEAVVSGQTGAPNEQSKASHWRKCGKSLSAWCVVDDQDESAMQSDERERGGGMTILKQL